MKQYQGLLLDLDNTLYCYQSAHRAGMEAFFSVIYDRCGVDRSIAQVAFLEARAAVNARLAGTAASHNRLLYMQKICEQLNLNSVEHVLVLYNSYWDAFLNSMTLFPDVKEFLTLWLGENKKICLITDLTAQIQYRKLQRLGLYDEINYIVTSEEIGHEKPHPEIFLAALKKLQLNIDQVIMIGDDYAKDIVGARNLGIDARLFSFGQAEIETEKTINFSVMMEMFQ